MIIALLIIFFIFFEIAEVPHFFESYLPIHFYPLYNYFNPFLLHLESIIIHMF